jgi:hypothetical protein
MTKPDTRPESAPRESDQPMPDCYYCPHCTNRGCTILHRFRSPCFVFELLRKHADENWKAGKAGKA